MADEDNEGLSRRSVLKSVGAAGVVSASSGVAGALRQNRDVVELSGREENRTLRRALRDDKTKI